jgi:hypothetical protein
MERINSIPSKIQSEEQRSSAAKHSFPINKLYMLLAVVLLLSFAASAQIQKGTDIDGEAGANYSGWATSMPDANTVAIGAYFNTGGGIGSGTGHVRVNEWNGSAWVQKGLDIDGEAAGDNSGNAVSMPDANTVAIGARRNDGSGTDAGHVRIYEWNGSAWVQKGIDIDGEAALDNSGFSVSMPDANTVAIGANGNDANGSSAGHVRIFQWNGSAWVQKGIDIDGEAAGDQSGYSVSMPDASTVAIGAYGNDAAGSSAGHVRIYEWNGSAWVQKGIDIDGEAAGDLSGWSVSMPDVNTVAIGGRNNDGNGSDSGHVRIYEWNGSAWLQKGIDIDGEAAGDLSGWSVSMPDASTVAIGAYGNDAAGFNAGHVRIYEWNGSAWVQNTVDIDGEAAGDRSGYSVSMPNANTVGIGAPLNDGNGAESGHVRVYNIAALALPIELLSFNAIGEGEHVKIYWSTANEINNDYFTIFRSKDGLIFEQIGTAQAAGNSSVVLNYVFYDEHPFEGSSYYKLKQTDFNGKYTYSDIKHVNFDEFKNISINIYPNPANHQITIDGETSEIIDFVIYNYLFQEVTGVVTVNSNESKIQLDVSQLPPGIYTLITNSGSTSSKFVKN